MASQQFRFIKSSYGGQLLIVNNYCFKRNSSYKSTVYYKCLKCVDGCPARANIKSNELKITEDHHNHESDIQYITKLETQNEIKEEISKNPSRPIKQAYNDVIVRKRQQLSRNTNSNEIAIILPTFKRIKANAYKKRSEYIPIELKNKEPT